MSKTSFPKSELEKLPYLRFVPQDGRAVIVKPYYEDSAAEWITLLPVEPDVLGQIAGGDVAKGAYLARSPADPARDYRFELGTFIMRHLTFTGVAGALGVLEHRVLHFAVILRKYDAFTRGKDRRDSVVSYLLESELEGLLVVVRSLYDHLQRLSKHAASLVRGLDEGRRRLIKDLPDSFAAVAIEKGEGRTQEQLQDRYGLPEPLAGFYAREAETFLAVRRIRDQIVHHGDQSHTVFLTRFGAALRADEDPWASLGIWSPQVVRDDRFGSLRSLFAFLAQHTLGMLDRYAEAYASCVVVPEALCPDSFLFLRHPVGGYLCELDAILERPWEWEDTSGREKTGNDA